MRELKQYLLGQTPAESVDDLEEHLLSCTAGVEVLCGQQDTNDFGRSRRQVAGSRDIPQGAEVEALVDRMRELAHRLARDQSTLLPSDQQARVEDTALGMAPPRQADEIGRLGAYRLLRILGAGGMGVVYAAEDTQLHRPVAIKVMKGPLAADTAQRQRFLREARIVASFTHDNIVAIFHIGEEGGAPYLVMPRLQGSTLQGRLAEGEKFGIDAILRIGREIALGLAAAHGQGLIHRDIKPGNVWLEQQGRLTAENAESAKASQPNQDRTDSVSSATSAFSAVKYRVKILDFGLSRKIEQDARITGAGTILGTPAYMAPEQASAGAVDARCDLYSLGVVLYELCTGRVPFQHKDLLAQVVALATETPRHVRELNPGVPADLADLIMRLMAKKPDARPTSAQAVVEEIERIEHRLAQPQRRRRVWQMVAALLLASIMGAWLWGARFHAPPNPGAQPAAAKLEPPPLSKPLREFLGHKAVVSGLAFSGSGKSAVSASWDWTIRVWDVETGRETRPPLEGHKGRIRALALSPKGDWLVTGGFDQTVRLWNLAGKKAPPPMGDHRGEVTAVAIGAKGSIASGGADGTVQLWDTFGHGGGKLETASGAIECLAMHADRWLLAGDDKGVLRRWDLDQQPEPHAERLSRDHAGPVTGVAWSGDGHWAASGSEDGKAWVREMPSARVVHELPHPEAVTVVCLDRTGRWLLTGCRDGHLRLWDVNREKAAKDLHAHAGPVFSAALSPDGQQALTGSSDGIIRLWDLAQTR